PGPVNPRLEHILGWVAPLLRRTGAGLMFAFHRDVRHLGAAGGAPPPSAAVSETHALPSRPEYVMAASRHTISFSPEGVTESRVSQVARLLSTDVGWEGAPVSQAADMRERDGRYDIAFALSRQLDDRSVQTMADGNVLSLTASAFGNPHATFLIRQFYIPIHATQIGDIETNVSNGVVRIRIHPKTF
ncbi:MAG: hypothetical protein FWH21_09340, partial [Kiritimatiellaeota bacterium]|nr:hypothetical protein [Kiritimatiellota bacterium]